MKSLKLLSNFIFLVIINSLILNLYSSNLISVKIFAGLFGILLFTDLLVFIFGIAMPTLTFIQENFSYEKKIYNFLWLCLLLTINGFCFHVMNNNLLSKNILNILFIGTFFLNIITGGYYITIISKGLKTHFGIDFENKKIQFILKIFLVQIPILVLFSRGLLNILQVLIMEGILTFIILPFVMFNIIFYKPEKEINEDSNEENEYINLEEKGNIESEDNNIYDEEKGNTESVSNQYKFSKQDRNNEINYNNQNIFNNKTKNGNIKQIGFNRMKN